MKLSPHSLVFYTCDLGHIFLSELSLLICKIIIISVTSWGRGGGGIGQENSGGTLGTVVGQKDTLTKS